MQPDLLPLRNKDDLEIGREGPAVGKRQSWIDMPVLSVMPPLLTVTGYRMQSLLLLYNIRWALLKYRCRETRRSRRCSLMGDSWVRRAHSCSTLQNLDHLNSNPGFALLFLCTLPVTSLSSVSLGMEAIPGPALPASLSNWKL